MSTHSFSRRIMIVMTVAAVALGGIALPAAAKGGPHARGKSQTVEVSAGKAKGEARKAAAKERRAAAQARRAARFVAVGFITAVDTAEATVQVQVKGGKKALRQSEAPVDFTVAEGAKVKLNGEHVTLDALTVGDHVMVKGAEVDGVLVARKVIASHPEEEEEELLEEEVEETGDELTGGTDGTVTE